MKHNIFLFTTSLILMVSTMSASTSQVTPPMPSKSHLYIIGGGIIGALESYSAFQEAQKNNVQISVTVFEKNHSLASQNHSPTNTAFNIVPSLTVDEILSVVPRGNEMVKKLAILFSEPGGIRVDDVSGVNDSPSASKFKAAVASYGNDPKHDDRTQTLLKMGKLSMDLWQQMYNTADSDLKAIMVASNFNPSREPNNPHPKTLHDGYRIDLIYDIPNAANRASSMKEDYAKLGYKHCEILSPEEVAKIDPSLASFCNDHSSTNSSNIRVWNNDTIALWRPGGCIDTKVFLPLFYNYLKKHMGQNTNNAGELVDNFSIKFDHEVTEIIYDKSPKQAHITGLKFSDGTKILDASAQYLFCPGEAVGTLSKLGFQEPAYAGFAGPSLMLTIPLTAEQIKEHKNFSHCMEVHREGIVLAWQARFIDNTIFIGVAGTKSFYGDKIPNKNEAFAKNRHLVQLNMINAVLPQFLSISLGKDTHGKQLTASDLAALENKGVANRWVGRRAVAYDGFPTLGTLYHNGQAVDNARCTTHLGSGGVSFGPAAVHISRSSTAISDTLTGKVLEYADSRR